MTGFSAIPLAEQGGGPHLVGIAHILGPRWAQLPAITIGLLGVQVFWSVEMSYGTPYLLSLGLSKAAVAMVFLAGPISGLIVQPLIGVLADNSKSRFGRRRPYMIVGCIICVSAMLLLGFTRPFASIFVSSPSVANDILTIWLAILALFTIDFSINAVQAVDRTLIVDSLPSAEQADANAWAARMLGLGSVTGYFIGNVDMTAVFPFLGNTELEVLAVVGSSLLLLTHSLTAFCTKEKVIIATKPSTKSLFRELQEIWKHMFSLPPAIRQICIIQFFSWVGWFPVLFYTSAFIGDLHKRASPLASSDPNLDAEAIRLGTRALFYSALLSFAGNVALPFIVAESARSRRLLERKLVQAHKSAWVKLYERVKVSLATMWAVSHLIFAVCMFATFFYSSVGGATFFTTLTGFSWSITQWAPFSLLAEAILTEQDGEESGTITLHDTRTHRRSGSLARDGDVHEQQFLVGTDEEEEDSDFLPRGNHADDEHTVALEEDVQSFSSDASMDTDRPRATSFEVAPPKPHRRSPTNSDEDEDGHVDGDGHTNEDRHPLLNDSNARASHIDVHSFVMSESYTPHDDGEEQEGQGLAAKAGVIIGIHNIFIVIPQFIMTGLASLIFAIVDPTSKGVSEPTALAAREGGGGPDSYILIYRLGGLSATVAFVLTLRLARELRHHHH